MLEVESLTGGGLGVSAAACGVCPKATNAVAANATEVRTANRRRGINRLTISPPKSHERRGERRKARRSSAIVPDEHWL